MKTDMKLYVFESVQPNHIFAVMAETKEQAIELVDKEANWTQALPFHHDKPFKLSVADRCNIIEVKPGYVFHRKLGEPHAMGG